MPAYAIRDWNDAYANMVNIPGGDRYPEKWAQAASAFRDAMGARCETGLRYGDGERNRFDLFRPEGESRGCVIFVHGGYWMRFDPSFFSHLAAGPLAHGWTVAMPAYSLCPAVGIADITNEVANAVGSIAALVPGPLRLAGHSAGGHLVTRMICANAPLATGVQARIVHTFSISGVHDLRPLLRLDLNSTLNLSLEEARAESPALLEPVEGARVTCWAGACERSEFVRQNALLANAWLGCGASTLAVEDPDRHHFDVVEALADPHSRLVGELLS